MSHVTKCIGSNRCYLFDPKEQAKFDLIYILFDKLARLFSKETDSAKGRKK